jgi:parallel beta-helix repeat protein
MRFAFLLLLSMQCAALPLWNGWVEGEGDFGNRRSIGRVASLLPFYETGDSTSFVYLRGLWDSGDAREGNIGLGHRQLCGCAVLGGYFFYDARTSAQRHTHQQLTVGVEGYTTCFEARLNGYIPISGDQELHNTGLAKAVIREDQVRLLCQANDRQRALPGFDGEIGYRYCCGCIEAKLLVGGYLFDKHRYKTVAGAKGRAELSVRNLPYGAKVTVGVEGYGDDIRSGEIGGIIRLQVPFGGCSRPCNLCSRLYERIERLDVLTRTRKSPLCESEALFKGREVSDVIFATDNLVAEVAAAPDDALIVVNGEIDVAATVDMKPGQILAGGGAELLMTGDCPCGSGILTVPGVGGTVTGDSPDPLIAVDTDGTVAGLTIEATNTAVSASGAPRAMVMDNTISTAASGAYGIFLEASADCQVSNNIVSTEGADAHGIFVSASSSCVVSGNSASTEGSGANGIFLSDSDNCEVSGNSTSTKESGANGIVVFGSSNCEVSGNSASTEEAAAHGIFLSISDNCEVSGNSTSTKESGTSGILLNNSDTCLVSGNSASTEGSNAHGIFLSTSDNCEVSGNSTSTEGSGANGILLGSSSDGCEVSGNKVSTEGSGADGISLASSDSSMLNDNQISTTGMEAPGIHSTPTSDVVTAIGNVIDTTGDLSDGIRLEGVNNATFGDNEITVSGANTKEISIFP